jgi:hypothetical protein
MQSFTYSELRKECGRLGCNLEVDEDCQCYRATAPHRMRFEPHLHELVAVFGNTFIGNGQTTAQARADLGYRLRGYASLEPCDDLKCDWCNHAQ